MLDYGLQKFSWRIAGIVVFYLLNEYNCGNKIFGEYMSNQESLFSEFLNSVQNLEPTEKAIALTGMLMQTFGYPSEKADAIAKALVSGTFSGNPGDYNGEK